MGKRAAISRISKDKPEAGSSGGEEYNASKPKPLKLGNKNLFGVLDDGDGDEGEGEMNDEEFVDNKSEVSGQFELHIRGLNKSFTESIDAKLFKNPASDLSGLFHQYTKHLQDIKGKYSTINTSEEAKRNLTKNLESKRIEIKSVKPFDFTAKPKGNDSLTISSAKPIEPIAHSMTKKTEGEKIEDPLASALTPTSAPKSKAVFSSFDFNSGNVNTANSKVKIEKSNENSNLNSKPSAFAFGSTSFGAASEPSKPISFGTTSFGSGVGGGFSFGTGTSTTTLTNTPFTFGSTNTDKPSALPAQQPFQFSFGSSVPSFGQKPATEPPLIKPSTTGENVDDGDDGEGIPIGEEESFSGERTNTELIKTGLGEENELTLIEQRCKLFILEKNKGWTDLGVSIFKVNQQKEDKSKNRILARMEGSGKILLNSWINSSIQVEYSEGKKEMSLICFNQEAKPAKYLIRCKDTLQVKELSNQINSLIKLNA